MKIHKKLGFTLVELIVVIVILGVLSTIGFVSYNGYLGGTRDSNRVTQLKNITDSLNLYTTRNDLPLPDDYVLTTAGSTPIGYQGYVGLNTLDLIDYTNGGTDPKDDTYFTYYLDSKRKNFQLLAFLEETDNIQARKSNDIQDLLIPQTYAADYSNRFPKTYGSKLGVLVLASNNTPIQEVGSIQTSGSLDIQSTPTEYTAYLDDTDTITGTGSALAILKYTPLTSLEYGENLVGYWDMRPINGNDLLLDLSGNNTHLHNPNDITIGNIIEGNNISTEFDGVNQSFTTMTTPTADSLDLVDDFSISVWIYPHSYKTVGFYGVKNVILSKGVSLSTVNYHLQASDADTITFIERGASQSLQGTNIDGISDMTNTWTHLVLVVQNSTLQLYVNGGLHASESIGLVETDAGSGDRFYIGGVSDSETFFDGYIDELKIFNIPLNETQVSYLYSNR